MTGFAPKASALRPIVEIVHDIDLKSDWLTGLVALGRLLVLLRWRVTNPILVAATRGDWNCRSPGTATGVGLREVTSARS